MKKVEEIQKAFIGIDVSKLTIDVSIITHQGEQDYHQFKKNILLFKVLRVRINMYDIFHFL